MKKASRIQISSTNSTKHDLYINEYLLVCYFFITLASWRKIVMFNSKRPKRKIFET